MITRLAGLLHDVGKLVQRTNPSIEFQPYNKFLVEDRGLWSHHHAAYTGHFITNSIKPNF